MFGGVRRLSLGPVQASGLAHLCLTAALVLVHVATASTATQTPTLSSQQSNSKSLSAAASASNTPTTTGTETISDTFISSVTVSLNVTKTPVTRSGHSYSPSNIVTSTQTLVVTEDDSGSLSRSNTATPSRATPTLYVVTPSDPLSHTSTKSKLSSSKSTTWQPTVSRSRTLTMVESDTESYTKSNETRSPTGSNSLSYSFTRVESVSATPSPSRDTPSLSATSDASPTPTVSLTIDIASATFTHSQSPSPSGMISRSESSTNSSSVEQSPSFSSSMRTSRFRPTPGTLSYTETLTKFVSASSTPSSSRNTKTVAKLTPTRSSSDRWSSTRSLTNMYSLTTSARIPTVSRSKLSPTPTTSASHTDSWWSTNTYSRRTETPVHSRSVSVSMSSTKRSESRDTSETKSGSITKSATPGHSSSKSVSATASLPPTQTKNTRSLSPEPSATPSPTRSPSAVQSVSTSASQAASVTPTQSRSQGSFSPSQRRSVTVHTNTLTLPTPTRNRRNSVTPLPTPSNLSTTKSTTWLSSPSESVTASPTPSAESSSSVSASAQRTGSKSGSISVGSGTLVGSETRTQSRSRTRTVSALLASLTDSQTYSSSASSSLSNDHQSRTPSASSTPSATAAVSGSTSKSIDSPTPSSSKTGTPHPPSTSLTPTESSLASASDSLSGVRSPSGRTESLSALPSATKSPSTTPSLALPASPTVSASPTQGYASQTNSVSATLSSTRNSPTPSVSTSVTLTPEPTESKSGMTPSPSPTAKKSTSYTASFSRTNEVTPTPSVSFSTSAESGTAAVTLSRTVSFSYTLTPTRMLTSSESGSRGSRTKSFSRTSTVSPGTAQQSKSHSSTATMTQSVTGSATASPTAIESATPTETTRAQTVTPTPALALTRTARISPTSTRNTPSPSPTPSRTHSNTNDAVSASRTVSTSVDLASRTITASSSSSGSVTLSRATVASSETQTLINSPSPTGSNSSTFSVSQSMSQAARSRSVSHSASLSANVRSKTHSASGSRSHSDSASAVPFSLSRTVTVTKSRSVSQSTTLSVVYSTSFSRSTSQTAEGQSSTRSASATPSQSPSDSVSSTPEASQTVSLVKDISQSHTISGSGSLSQVVSRYTQSLTVRRRSATFIGSVDTTVTKSFTFTVAVSRSYSTSPTDSSSPSLVGSVSLLRVSPTRQPSPSVTTTILPSVSIAPAPTATQEPTPTIKRTSKSTVPSKSHTVSEMVTYTVSRTQSISTMPSGTSTRSLSHNSYSAALSTSPELAASASRRQSLSKSLSRFGSASHSPSALAPSTTVTLTHTTTVAVTQSGAPSTSRTQTEEKTRTVSVTRGASMSRTWTRRRRGDLPSGTATPTLTQTQSSSVSKTQEASRSASVTKSISMVRSRSNSFTVTINVTKTLTLSPSTTARLTPTSTPNPTPTHSPSQVRTNSKSGPTTSLSRKITITRTQTVTVDIPSQSETFSATPTNTTPSSLTKEDTMTISDTRSVEFLSLSTTRSPSRVVTGSRSTSWTITSIITVSTTPSQSPSPFASSSKTHPSASRSQWLSFTSTLSRVTRTMRLSPTSTRFPTPTATITPPPTPSRSSTVSLTSKRSRSHSPSGTNSQSTSIVRSSTPSDTTSVTVTLPLTVTTSRSRTADTSGSRSVTISTSTTFSVSISSSVSADYSRTVSHLHSTSITVARTPTPTLNPSHTKSRPLPETKSLVFLSVTTTVTKSLTDDLTPSLSSSRTASTTGSATAAITSTRSGSLTATPNFISPNSAFTTVPRTPLYEYLDNQPLMFTFAGIPLNTSGDRLMLVYTSDRCDNTSLGTIPFVSRSRSSFVHNWTAIPRLSGDFTVCYFSVTKLLWQAIVKPVVSVRLAGVVAAGSLWVLNRTTAWSEFTLVVYGANVSNDRPFLVPFGQLCTTSSSSAGVPGVITDFNASTYTVRFHFASLSAPGDYTVCYTAFPHFPARSFSASLSRRIRIGGTVTIASPSSPPAEYKVGHTVSYNMVGLGLSIRDQFLLTNSSSNSTPCSSPYNVPGSIRVSWGVIQPPPTSSSTNPFNNLGFTVVFPLSVPYRLTMCYRSNFSSGFSVVKQLEYSVAPVLPTWRSPNATSAGSGPSVWFSEGSVFQTFVGESVSNRYDSAYLMVNCTTCTVTENCSAVVPMVPFTSLSSTSFWIQELPAILRRRPQSAASVHATVCYQSNFSALLNMGVINIDTQFWNASDTATSKVFLEGARVNQNIVINIVSEDVSPANAKNLLYLLRKTPTSRCQSPAPLTATLPILRNNSHVVFAPKPRDSYVLCAISATTASILNASLVVLPQTPTLVFPSTAGAGVTTLVSVDSATDFIAATQPDVFFLCGNATPAVAVVAFNSTTVAVTPTAVGSYAVCVQYGLRPSLIVQVAVISVAPIVVNATLSPTVRRTGTLAKVTLSGFLLSISDNLTLCTPSSAVVLEFASLSCQNVSLPTNGGDSSAPLTSVGTILRCVSLWQASSNVTGSFPLCYRYDSISSPTTFPEGPLGLPLTFDSGVDAVVPSQVVSDVATNLTVVGAAVDGVTFLFIRYLAAACDQTPTPPDAVFFVDTNGHGTVWTAVVPNLRGSFPLCYRSFSGGTFQAGSLVVVPVLSGYSTNQDFVATAVRFAGYPITMTVRGSALSLLDTFFLVHSAVSCAETNVTRYFLSTNSLTTAALSRTLTLQVTVAQPGTYVMCYRLSNASLIPLPSPLLTTTDSFVVTGSTVALQGPAAQAVSLFDFSFSLDSKTVTPFRSAHTASSTTVTYLPFNKSIVRADLFTSAGTVTLTLNTTLTQSVDTSFCTNFPQTLQQSDTTYQYAMSLIALYNFDVADCYRKIPTNYLLGPTSLLAEVMTLTTSYPALMKDLTTTLGLYSKIAVGIPQTASQTESTIQSVLSATAQSLDVPISQITTELLESHTTLLNNLFDAAASSVASSSSQISQSTILTGISRLDTVATKYCQLGSSAQVTQSTYSFATLVVPGGVSSTVISAKGGVSVVMTPADVTTPIGCVLTLEAPQNFIPTAATSSSGAHRRFEELDVSAGLASTFNIPLMSISLPASTTASPLKSFSRLVFSFPHDETPPTPFLGFGVAASVYRFAASSAGASTGTWVLDSAVSSVTADNTTVYITYDMSRSTLATAANAPSSMFLCGTFAVYPIVIPPPTTQRDFSLVIYVGSLALLHAMLVVVSALWGCRAVKGDKNAAAAVASSVARRPSSHAVVDVHSPLYVAPPTAPRSRHSGDGRGGRDEADAVYTDGSGAAKPEDDLENPFDDDAPPNRNTNSKLPFGFLPEGGQSRRTSGTHEPHSDGQHANPGYSIVTLAHPPTTQDHDAPSRLAPLMRDIPTVSQMNRLFQPLLWTTVSSIPDRATPLFTYFFAVSIASYLVLDDLGRDDHIIAYNALYGFLSALVSIPFAGIPRLLLHRQYRHYPSWSSSVAGVGGVLIGYFLSTVYAATIAGSASALVVYGVAWQSTQRSYTISAELVGRRTFALLGYALHLVAEGGAVALLMYHGTVSGVPIVWSSRYDYFQTVGFALAADFLVLEPLKAVLILALAKRTQAMRQKAMHRAEAAQREREALEIEAARAEVERQRMEDTRQQFDEMRGNETDSEWSSAPRRVSGVLGRKGSRFLPPTFVGDDAGTFVLAGTPAEDLEEVDTVVTPASKRTSGKSLSESSFRTSRPASLDEVDAFAVKDSNFLDEISSTRSSVALRGGPDPRFGSFVHSDDEDDKDEDVVHRRDRAPFPAFSRPSLRFESSSSDEDERRHRLTRRSNSRLSNVSSTALDENWDTVATDDAALYHHQQHDEAVDGNAWQPLSSDENNSSETLSEMDDDYLEHESRR